MKLELTRLMLGVMSGISAYTAIGLLFDTFPKKMVPYLAGLVIAGVAGALWKLSP